MGYAPTPAPLRFWPKVQITPTCWLWTASCDHGGYGGFNVGQGRHVGAHRFAYELLVGPIPKGLYLDHLCRTPACVNPTHLEPVTPAENVYRGVSPFAQKKRQTHCLRGHPFDELNTTINKRGSRECRACRNARWRARAKAKAAA